MTVLEATRFAYDHLPDEFFGSSLIRRVRNILNNHSLYDGTILRRLRHLRSNNEINYSATGNSEYTKL